MKPVHFSFLQVGILVMAIFSYSYDFEGTSTNTTSISQNGKDYFYFQPDSWAHYTTKTHLSDSLRSQPE